MRDIKGALPQNVRLALERDMISCATQSTLISVTDIGEEEVKNPALKVSRVFSKHQNLAGFPFGPERIHELGIATVLVIPFVAGTWSMQDGWIRAVRWMC